MSEESLPTGWVEVPFEDLLIKLSNGTTKTQSKEPPGIPVSRIETISDAKINFEKVRYVRDVSPDLRERFLLQPGDILFSHINSDSHLGKCALFKGGRELLHGMNLLVMRMSAAATPKFIEQALTYLRAGGYFIQIAQHAVNQSSLNQKKIKQIPIPLPPLAEQKRIVAKIEELFSELDAGEESLRRARHQLGVYRQSLLKQAFEGKLTAQWRAQHPDLLESPDQLLARIQAELATSDQSRTRKAKRSTNSKDRKVITRRKGLPDAWLLLPLRDFGTAITGNTPPTKDLGNYGADVPFVKPPDLTNHPVAQTEAYLSHRGTRVGRVLPENSVLVTCIGNLGRVGINRIPAAFNQQINAVVSVPSVDSFYLFYGAQTTDFRNQLEGMASATTISIVNKGNFEQILVPICSLPEQQEIVRILDEQFEVIEQNEREIDAALKRSEALRQAILKKAFTGQLVPQDPTDEPAAELLARIREEREAAERTKPAAKNRTTRKKKAARRR